MQSYPVLLVEQVIVKAVLARGLFGVTIGVPRPQSLQDGDDTKKDIV